MDECLGLSKKFDGFVVLLVVYLICNQILFVGDMFSLMSFEEVEIFFYEFGYGFQYMFIIVEELEVVGISNVEWDVVEFFSQFMENWCFDYVILMGMVCYW